MMLLAKINLKDNRTFVGTISAVSLKSGCEKLHNAADLKYGEENVDNVEVILEPTKTNAREFEVARHAKHLVINKYGQISKGEFFEFDYRTGKRKSK